MAAMSSSAAADLMVMDDLHLLALCHGSNQADATDLLAISDEDYAMQLQLQEVIVSSVMAAMAAQSSLTPELDSAVHANNDAAAAPETAALAVVECRCSFSSSSPSSSKSLATPSAGEYAASAATTSVVVIDAEICKICLDYISPSDVQMASRGCAHAFCAACLARYIGTKIQDGISGIKCPGEDCGGVLDPELCQGILSREAFEAWGAALCMSMVLGSGGDVCYCPFSDCSEIMVDERGGEVPESECPVCRRLFCAWCRVPWHSGISCAECGQLAPGDRGKEDLLVLEMAKGKKWRRCPRCKFLVDKHDGCMHITCRCGIQFCYVCGELWGQSDHSSCNTPS